MARLDSLLVDLGLAPSRERAKAAVRAGLVTVNGTVARKASQAVPDGAALTYEPEHPWVSRGALKLVAALEAFGFDPARRVCVDVGASTGGFTQVLLSRGAARVYAVDVGEDQLDARVAADPRVVSLQRLNARDLTRDHLPEPPSLLVCDVSFIGLEKALPAALSLCAPSAEAAVLVKPQFEVGRARIGKGGLVRDQESLPLFVQDEIVPWFEGEGWSVLGVEDSPVLGGDGNREFLLGARRG